MNKELLRKDRKKRRKWKQFKQTGEICYFEEYQKLERSVKKDVKKAKKTYERKIANNNKDNKAFNRYIKNNSAIKDTIGPLKNQTGDITNDEAEMAEILNRYFSSVFTQETDDVSPTTETNNCGEEIRTTKFNKKDILNAIKS